MPAFLSFTWQHVWRHPEGGCPTRKQRCSRERCRHCSLTAALECSLIAGQARRTAVRAVLHHLPALLHAALARCSPARDGAVITANPLQPAHTAMRLSVLSTAKGSALRVRRAHAWRQLLQTAAAIPPALPCAWPAPPPLRAELRSPAPCPRRWTRGCGRSRRSWCGTSRAWGWTLWTCTQRPWGSPTPPASVRRPCRARHRAAGACAWAVEPPLDVALRPGHLAHLTVAWRLLPLRSACRGTQRAASRALPR